MRFQRSYKGRQDLYYTDNGAVQGLGEFAFRDLPRLLLARTVSIKTSVSKKVYARVEKIRCYIAKRSMCRSIRLLSVFCTPGFYSGERYV